MKKKELTGKLAFNKETVSNLNGSFMSRILAGAPGTGGPGEPTLRPDTLDEDNCHTGATKHFECDTVTCVSFANCNTTV